MTTRAVALVSYNSIDLIPASLRPVAYVTASVTDAIMRVTGTFYSSFAAAPVDAVCWGAVNYANPSLVPPQLIVVGNETPSAVTPIPLTVPNCEHWLKADAITGLSDADPVATWPDSSGNAKHATQATAAKQPAYKTNRQNGLPGVLFAENDDWMTAGYDPILPFTAFLVYKRIGGGGRVIQGANNWLVGPFNAIHVYYNSGFIEGLNVAVNQNVYTTIKQASGDAEMRQTGVSEGTNANSTIPGTLYLGSNGAFPAEGANCDVYELITYSRILSAAEISTIETYLVDRYAL